MHVILVQLQVSWIRRKDYHLLTVSMTTYSSDERYSVTHLTHSEVRGRVVVGEFIFFFIFFLNLFFLDSFPFQDWTLQIKYVQMRDAGLYECQVSTHPPTSIFVDLQVVGK